MTEPVGYYLVNLLVEQQGPVGAPALHLQLGVNAVTGQIMGSGEITQALPPPYGQTHLPQVTGSIFHTGFGQDTMLVHLSGQYVVSVPPPAIGSYLAQFSAALAVDKAWNGKGSFSYANHNVTGCEVTNESPAAVSNEQTLIATA
ncbi:DUF1842 domain-containing protein [Sphingomonas sp. AOB5]|uniref:DUF1842 domain-containing protein n=1 Tax=Sphingomonas sp. AOB5 TaxID=3034017 RepID=UPI0023F6F506|nr:DUF1842 domain-containing protein [Sphingomonas sp. AOB5]MDF7774956.1 DUF1842 domain-containing protein [Sphingomonas sp. AOB5]